MGNRAVIIGSETLKPTKNPHTDYGVYLHWNGGMDTIKPLCALAKKLGIRPLNQDSSYGAAYLAGLMTSFFADGLSVGIVSFNHEANKTEAKLREQLTADLDPGDNGIYFIDDDWSISDRIKFLTKEQDDHQFYDMLEELVKCQGPGIVKQYQESKNT